MVLQTTGDNRDFNHDSSTPASYTLKENHNVIECLAEPLANGAVGLIKQR
jgi:hypothetical protein